MRTITLKNLMGFFFFLQIGSFLCAQDFITLQRQFAELPENIVSDNDDWNNPDYRTWYKSKQKSPIHTILRFFKLQKDEPFSIERIEKKLKEMLVARWFYAPRKEVAKQGISYAEHITAKPGTKFIVWGDVFGAAHSLFRGLEYWHERGVIDDSLTIIKPDYYFVFLGNFVGRSVYSLETLYIILLLMQRNSEKVIILNGRYETDDYWKNSDLKKQIIAELDGYENKKSVDFENLVSNFFSSLTEALYITHNDGTKNMICLSSAFPTYRLDYSHLKDFFSKDVGTIDIIPVSKMVTKEITPTIIIKGGDLFKTSRGVQGLTLELPHNNATVWSVLSCPTLLYQKFANFYQDSFVELTTGTAVSQATIQLFSQDLRNKNGFKAGPLLDLLTGQVKHKNANEKTTYLVGSTMALTKGGFYLALPTKFVIEKTINKSNKEDFLHGSFVKAIILDDQYDAVQAVENVKKLLDEYGINTLLSPVGSPTLSGYFDLVKSGAISVLFPATGSTDFRRAEYTNIIHWRPSYHDEVRALIEYMVKQEAAKKFAFFYQADSYGLPPLQAAHEILKKNGITDWIDIPYNQYDVSFDVAVQELNKFQPDAIGIFSIPGPTKAFFSQIGSGNLLGKKIFGLSGIEDDDFKKFLRDKGIKVTFIETVPSPKMSNLEIVKEYRALMDVYNYPYDVFGLEAYIATCLYLEALKSIQGTATGRKIIEYFEQFNNYLYKGLRMTFDPLTRSLSKKLWLRQGDTWLQELDVPIKNKD